MSADADAIVAVADAHGTRLAEAIVDALVEAGIDSPVARMAAATALRTLADNHLVAAPDDHETPRGRDGADTGCTEVPDGQREGPSAASITNVLGQRDAEGSHLVALAERDAALARVAELEARLGVDGRIVADAERGLHVLPLTVDDFMTAWLDAAVATAGCTRVAAAAVLAQKAASRYAVEVDEEADDA